MKILFLNYEYPPLGGGAANATKFLLAEYAKRENIEVDLITSAVGEHYEREREGDNVVVHRVPIGKRADTLHHQSQKDLIKYSFVGYEKADELMALEHYDVIHAFFGVPCGVMAYFLSKKYEVPYLVSLRGSDVPGYSDRFSFLYIFLTPLIRFVWKKAARVVANSQGLKELAHQTESKQAIPVIENGVDTLLFHPDASKRDRSHITLTAGATRLTERKGHRFVIEAMGKLRERFPELRFEVMGEGSAEEKLKAQAAELGISDQVRFLGRIPAAETHQYYERADIFVLPSANEGMSNALLEALASGLPAIVTDTGGSRELVDEGINGLYIEPGDAQSIADALEKLVSNEGLRHRMGATSRAKAEAKNWSSVAEKYLEMYKEVYEDVVGQV